MNLVERCKENTQDRLKWLHEAIEAEVMTQQLPAELREMDATLDGEVGGSFTLVAHGGDVAKRTLEEAGVMFETPKVQSFSGSFKAKGIVPWFDGNMEVHVYGLDVPANCVVEREDYIATRYKAICNETGEEVK